MSDDELSYLQPGFDLSTLTVPRLRAILVSHDIPYPSSAKKPQLIQLLTDRCFQDRESTGILYVTMQPQPSLPTAQFQDWYNNEHGPGRLRLPFCENGFRYCGTDLEGSGKGMPEWMAVYDITDMAEMNKETYLRFEEGGGAESAGEGYDGANQSG